MFNKNLVILFLVSFFPNDIVSLSVVKNITFSSDVLSDIFIKEIKNENSYPDVSEHMKYDSQKCLWSLRKIIDILPNLDAARFFDSWGRFPPGALSGNFYDIGNFDQCVQTAVTFNESQIVGGQYCLSKIIIRNDNMVEEKEINIGICVPDSCSPELISTIFQHSAVDVPDRVFSDIYATHCTDGKIPSFKPIHLMGITIFTFFGALIAASSLYDFYTTYWKRTATPVLLAFSIFTNGKKLFAINTKKSPNNIDCLTGIRAITMLFIINHHIISNIPGLPILNANLASDYSKSFEYKNREFFMFRWAYSLISLITINGPVMVDSFFFISGLLVGWQGFQQLDKAKGKLDIIMRIVHRYFRLTPVLAAGILLNLSIKDLLFTGPFKDISLAKDACNRFNWWPVLLYIQNYYVQDTKCVFEAWYLAVDFQLYVLSAVLLIAMWKWKRMFTPVLLFLSLLSIGYSMRIFLTEGYTGMTLGSNEGDWEKVYTPMHTRCAPWLVGFALSYFMLVNRNNCFNISKITQLVAWIFSFAFLYGVVFLPHYMKDENYETTVLGATLYEGLKKVLWPTSLAWITFACYFGYGGPIDSFLSHPFWQPLARLSYSIYLTHLFVIRMHDGMIHTAIYFSYYNLFLKFWSVFGISLLFGITFCLAFEMPFLVLEKFIFYREKSEKEQNKEKTVSKINSLDISKKPS